MYMDVFLPLFACACYFACLRVFFFVLLICSDFSWVTSIVVSVTANNSCISICWNDSQGSFWCDTWMEWVLKNSLGKSFQPYTFSGLLTDFQILIILAPSLLCNSFLFDSPIVPEWFIILFFMNQGYVDACFILPSYVLIYMYYPLLGAGFSHLWPCGIW